MSTPTPPPAAPNTSQVQCSAKGCRAQAAWVLVWANPRIHTGGRTKTWAACDEHRQSLGEFLGVRGFLREVVPLAQWEQAEREQAEQEQAEQDQAQTE